MQSKEDDLPLDKIITNYPVIAPGGPNDREADQNILNPNQDRNSEANIDQPQQIDDDDYVDAYPDACHARCHRCCSQCHEYWCLNDRSCEEICSWMMRVFLPILIIMFFIGIGTYIFLFYESFRTYDKYFAAVTASEHKLWDIAALVLAIMILFQVFFVLPLYFLFYETSEDYVIFSLVGFIIIGFAFFLITIYDIKFHRSCDKLQEKIVANAEILDGLFPPMNEMLEKYNSSGIGIVQAIGNFVGDNCGIRYELRAMSFAFTLPVTIIFVIAPLVLFVIIFLFGLCC